MRLEQLTFTRFIAAISIVIYHFGAQIFPFNLSFVQGLFENAYVGVSYFFILSGFVMIIAYGNKTSIGYADYLKKRFARIYPIYFLGIVIVLGYSMLPMVKRPINLNEIFLNFFMLQGWIPGFPLTLNSPGWSLSVEMFFYISFPFLFNSFYKKYPFKKIVIMVLFVFLVTQIIFHLSLSSSFYVGYPSKSHDLLFYFPLMHINEFLIGNIAGLFFMKGVKKRNYDLTICALITLLIILLSFNFGINFHDGMLAFVFVPFIILLSSNTGKFTTWFNGKSATFLGEISYGIYILQMPIFIWVNGIMHYFKINDAVLNFYIPFFVLIVSSSISYIFIEKPLRDKINKIWH